MSFVFYRDELYFWNRVKSCLDGFTDKVSIGLCKWEDDCEVDAGIYGVGLHDMGYLLTFA